MRKLTADLSARLGPRPGWATASSRRLIEWPPRRTASTSTAECRPSIANAAWCAIGGPREVADCSAGRTDDVMEGC